MQTNQEALMQEKSYEVWELKVGDKLFVVNGIEMELIKEAEKAGIKVLFFDKFSINLSFFQYANRVADDRPTALLPEGREELTEEQQKIYQERMAELKKQIYDKTKKEYLSQDTQPKEVK